MSKEPACHEHLAVVQQTERTAKDVDILFGRVREQEKILVDLTLSVQKLHQDRLWIAGILSFVMLFVAPIANQFIARLLVPAPLTSQVSPPPSNSALANGAAPR